MRNLITFSLLFSSALLVSCSREASTEDLTDNDIELEEPKDSNAGGTDQPEEDLLDESVVLKWKSYYNQRFNFCVGYPSNFLKPTGESENHDGNTFENANGSSEMRASGILNVLDETIAEAFENATEDNTYYEDERIITYKAQKNNWFVVSGRYYESIFCVRTILIEDTFYTLYFEYHQSEEDTFKEIIRVTTQDFPKC